MGKIWENMGKYGKTSGKSNNFLENLRTIAKIGGNYGNINMEKYGKIVKFSGLHPPWNFLYGWG